MFLCPSPLASQENEVYHAILQSDADELDKERLVQEALSRLAPTMHRRKIVALCEVVLILLLVGSSTITLVPLGRACSRRVYRVICYIVSSRFAAIALGRDD
jgi:hypothetical protein